MSILGIDVGGSAVKGAPVDIVAGRLLAERVKIATPQLATPAQVAATVVALAASFDTEGAVGVVVPAVVKHGVTHTAANIDPAWIGCNMGELLQDVIGRPVAMLNDADAAGIAEMRFGAGQDRRGTVVLLTLGTGIGSAVFVDGLLLPNTEFGHMIVDGEEAEHRAAALVRKVQHLSWAKWAGRLSEVMIAIEQLLWPDLFIIGGGVSRKHEKFLPLLQCRTPVVPAALGNDAGIVGAAMVAGSPPQSFLDASILDALTTATSGR